MSRHSAEPWPPPPGGQPQYPYAGQPNAGPPYSGQPNARPPYSGQPNARPPYSGQPNAGPPYSGQPNAGPPYSGQPNAGPPYSGQPNAAAQPPSAPPYAGAGPEYQGKDDPRYPSPRRVRQVLAFAVDLALSLGSAVGAFFLGRHVHQHFVATYVTVDALAALIVVSFVHRTIVQWVFRTTLGKALFGLVLIRREDGGRPGFWKLVKVWLTGVWYGVSALSDTFGNAASGTDYTSTAFLPAVRFRDVRALRRARTSLRR